MIVFLLLIFSTLNELYEQGKYFAVIEQAEKALNDTSLTTQDRAGIHTILAFSYVALGKKELAKLEFMEALAINPELELDPVMTSPKIIESFQEAKRTFHFLQGEKFIRQVPKKDLLSFVVPGVWDIRNGNKIRGRLLLGSSSLSILSLGLSHYQCEKYHQAYLDARAPNTIEDKYKIYSLWYKTRTCFLVATILTYTINLLLLASSPYL